MPGSIRNTASRASMPSLAAKPERRFGTREKSRQRPESALQPQFRRAVLPEQIAVSDIAPKHLNRFVPGLRHDRPLRRSRNGSAGGMPGPERVPSILGSVQTGAVHQFLHHARHVDTGQPTRFESCFAYFTAIVTPACDAIPPRESLPPRSGGGPRRSRFYKNASIACSQ